MWGSFYRTARQQGGQRIKVELIESWDVRPNGGIGCGMTVKPAIAVIADRQALRLC
jgi:hypothetical protein